MQPLCNETAGQHQQSLMDQQWTITIGQAYNFVFSVQSMLILQVQRERESWRLRSNESKNKINMRNLGQNCPTSWWAMLGPIWHCGDNLRILPFLADNHSLFPDVCLGFTSQAAVQHSSPDLNVKHISVPFVINISGQQLSIEYFLHFQLDTVTFNSWTNNSTHSILILLTFRCLDVFQHNRPLVSIWAGRKGCLKPARQR